MFSSKSFSKSFSISDFNISTKINQRIGLIRRIRNLLPLQARVTLYNALILPLFDYGDVVWGDKNNDTLMSELQILLNKAAKVMLGHPSRSSSTKALNSLDLKPLSTRQFFHRCLPIHKCVIGETDFNFNFISNQAVHSYNIRRSNDLRSPLPRTNWGKQTFNYQAAKDWKAFWFYMCCGSILSLVQILFSFVFGYGNVW